MTTLVKKKRSPVLKHAQSTGDQSPNLVFGHEPFLIKTFPISKCPTDSRKLNLKFVQSFQAEI